MPFHSDADVLEAVARKSARAAAAAHQDLKRGLSSLASIAATAPFVGLFGTVVGIAGSSRSFSISKEAFQAAIMASLSESMISTALGLLVAIAASWIYSYLSSELETFDLEMQNASLPLINQLILFRPRPNPR